MHYAYRSWRRQWGASLARQCGGALVWQFNDCWPAISWALVDYFLVKKPAFYAIKRALSPIAIAVLRTHQDWTEGHTSIIGTCTYDVWIASSRVDGTEESLVELRFISIRTGEEVLPSQQHKMLIQPNSTTTICENVKIANPPSLDAFVILAKLMIDGGVISRDVDWPQPYKYLDLERDATLKVHLCACRQRIEISASKPTKGVVFNERPGLYFSDNGFDVMPGEEHTVDVRGLKEDELLSWTFLGANGIQSVGRKLRAQL
jgi:beta-mannosidase